MLNIYQLWKNIWKATAYSDKLQAVSLLFIGGTVFYLRPFCKYGALEPNFLDIAI